MKRPSERIEADTRRGLAFFSEDLRRGRVRGGLTLDPFPDVHFRIPVRAFSLG